MAKQDTKSRFNIFDALLILVIVACIAALVFRYYYNSKDSLDEQVRVSFIVPEVMESTADTMTEKLRMGTVIYLSDGDSIIGYIQSVSKEPSKVYVENGAGNVERVDHPFSMDVRGVAVLYGRSGENGFYIGGSKLATVSDVIYVYSTDVEFSMTLTGIGTPTAK